MPWCTTLHRSFTGTYSGSLVGWIDTFRVHILLPSLTEPKDAFTRSLSCAFALDRRPVLCLDLLRSLQLLQRNRYNWQRIPCCRCDGRPCKGSIATVQLSESDFQSRQSWQDTITLG